MTIGKSTLGIHSTARKQVRQKRCRRRAGRVQKAFEYSALCDADVCVGIRIRDWRSAHHLCGRAGILGFCFPPNGKSYSDDNCEKLLMIRAPSSLALFWRLALSRARMTLLPAREKTPPIASAPRQKISKTVGRKKRMLLQSYSDHKLRKWAALKREMYATVHALLPRLKSRLSHGGSVKAAISIQQVLPARSCWYPWLIHTGFVQFSRYFWIYANKYWWPSIFKADIVGYRWDADKPREGSGTVIGWVCGPALILVWGGVTSTRLGLTAEALEKLWTFSKDEAKSCLIQRLAIFCWEIASMYHQTSWPTSPLSAAMPLE